MTSTLVFQIADWIAASFGEAVERETLASLKITAGPRNIPVTEVEDTLAHTVRNHINVPAYALARWLVVNWWRLRWEPLRENPSLDWLQAHSMAAIGGDYAWPALQLASDGEFVQLRLEAELAPDVSALRYLRDITIDIPALDFEQAVDSFRDQAEARMAARIPAERELSELRTELGEERRDATQATACRLQALAGIDAGSASQLWFREVEALTSAAGSAAVEEILATVPDLRGGLEAANSAISAMKESSTTIKLDWTAAHRVLVQSNEAPWERGARLAVDLRRKVGVPSGPLLNKTLQDLLETNFPLDKTTWNGERGLSGGYRNGYGHGRTALLVTSGREDSQRFFLARMIAAAVQAPAKTHVLAVSDARTALQKLERAFAQEFLCPWQDLEDFIKKNGTDDDGIADAAGYFSVSELVVLTTLVNKGKLPRSRLQT